MQHCKYNFFLNNKLKTIIISYCLEKKEKLKNLKNIILKKFKVQR